MDAIIYAWREEQGDVWTGEWALDRSDKWVPAEANKYILATPEALAASPEVAKLVADAVARGWNNGMRIATSHVADVRNTQKPGAVFAALNEAMGRIEGARFAAIRRASEEAGT